MRATDRIERPFPSAHEGHSQEGARYALSRLGEALAQGSGGLLTFERGSLVRRPYRAVLAEVARTRGYLRSLGLRPGDRVGIALKTGLPFVTLDLACIAEGFVSVPLDYQQLDRGAAWVEDYGLARLFADVRDGDLPPRMLSMAQATEDLAACEPVTTPWYTYAADEVYTTKLTSGTSARPKVIETRAAHFQHMAHHVSVLFALSLSDSFLSVLPLHVWLQRFFVHLAILHGFDCAFGRLERLPDVLAQVRPTLLVAVPHVLKTALAAWSRAREQSSTQTFQQFWGGRMRSLWTGSAPLPRDLMDAYQANGLLLHEGYGMSETGLIAKNAPGACKPGSVGRPFPDKLVRLDEDGQILVQSAFHASDHYAVGGPQPGAVSVRGETAFLEHGWVATGDVGHFDDEGYLYVTGRLNDTLVLTSGKKVQPTEIEQIIVTSPRVAQCCVVGHARPFVTAILVLRAADDAVAIDAELRNLNAQLTAESKVRRWITARETFSAENGLLTSTGKLKRKAVEAAHEAELFAVYRGE